MTPAIFGMAGLTLTADERAFFREADPAGYILFGRNVQSREQLRALTDELRGLAGRDRLLISIDQEGGRVARMKPPVWAAFPPGQVFDRLYDVSPASAIEAARANAHALGLDLAEVGINFDCLPLLDVRDPSGHDVIGDRALGAEPLRVAALGRAVLDGLAAAGVTGIVKHIPGHGRTRVDSHKALPVVDVSVEELERDLHPFRALAKAPAAMTAHVIYRAWDAERPATLSPTVIGKIIRETIGFDGLLMSDDLDMDALSGSVPELAAAAIAAGCDLALNCWADMPDMVGIAESCPPLTERGHARLERALAAAPAAPKLDDRAALIDKRDRLLALA